jgi:hypothetical protein
MKRLPFNTITVLWGIVIFLASCAFTTKTQKAQSETVKQEQKKAPTPEFLKKVKASKTYLKGGGEYYDFRIVDFEDYEKPTFENLFTTYADLSGLSEDDKMSPLHDIQFKDKKYHPFPMSQEIFSEMQYQHFHKGLPVIPKKGGFYQITVYGDSTGKYVWKVLGGILPKLDVDTTVTLTNKEAFNIAKGGVPINKEKGEYFTWEEWSDLEYVEGRYSSQTKTWFDEPVGYKAIYDGKIAYVFDIPKKETIFVTYVVFVDAQSGELLYVKKPNVSHLTKPTTEPKKSMIESEVEYTIDNPALSGANNEFLEFDIDVASMLNNEDFYSGELLIDYNALTFGTNLASSGRITLTKGTVITAPNYTLNIVDVSPDQMKIIVQNTSSNPSNYYTITNQSEELAHIKIDISNLAGNTAIEFDEVQMQGLSELFDASISSNEPFDLVTASEELNIDINGIVNSMNNCTTCPSGVGAWLQNQNCPPFPAPFTPSPCPCTDSIFSDITEAAPTHYYQCQDIGFKDCTNYDLIDLKANGVNENILVQQQNAAGPPSEINWCRINNETALSSSQLIEANAMYSVQTSNSYFTNAFGINSYDNNGSIIYVTTHIPSNNANGTPPNANTIVASINLGDGVAGECGPMVSLDVVSHEFTHLILGAYIRIGQNNITGEALQEAICDIFSIIVRYHESGGLQTWGGKSIWTIGEESCTNNPDLPRLLDNTLGSAVPQAAYYQDPTQGWDNGPNPNEYNHAGVISLWFARLSKGGGGVTPLGIDGAEAILVKALKLMQQKVAGIPGNPLQDYTFEDFRDFTINAVIDLHGACSPQHKSVVDAWVSVGLFDCANISITFEENDPTPADPCDKELTAKVNNGSGCYTYEWFEIDGANIINLNLTTQTIPVVCNKVYRVKVTDTYLGTVVEPCEHEDNHSVFATSTRKVEELNLDITIRPTLANNQIFFDLEVEEPTIITISIFDQLGRRISQPIVNEKVYQGNKTIQHNVENLSSGIYFVSIETPKGKIVKKFVKM